LSPPLPGNAFAAMPDWMQAVLTGPIGLSLGTLAVAGTGLGLLAGRMSFRKASRMVLGCFLLFGAGNIAQGLISVGDARRVQTQVVYPSAKLDAPFSEGLIRPESPTAASSNPFDPYAGNAGPK